MKKILLIITTIVITCGFTSCKHTYNTYSSGKDNNSYVLVLKEDVNVRNASIVIDDQTFEINKVYPERKARKAHPIIIAPGKHTIKLIVDNHVIREENIFIGLQETKKIIITKQDFK